MVGEATGFELPFISVCLLRPCRADCEAICFWETGPASQAGTAGGRRGRGIGVSAFVKQAALRPRL